MTNSGQFTAGSARTFEKTCTECDQPFEATSGNQRKCAACRSCRWCGTQLRYSHKQFCNNSCAGKWKAANSEAVSAALTQGRAHPNRAEGIRRYMTGRERPEMRREKNPNWKGGTYGTIRHTEMGRVQYKAWRLAVFKRDGFACVTCGMGGRLQAHHIHPWRSTPDRWFDVTNGITLCGPCHRAIGSDEAAFADRFEQHALTCEPVELTDEERARFVPLLVTCGTCSAELRRPRHHGAKTLHFCDKACRQAFEKAIGSNWRGYAAGKIPHPFRPAAPTA